MREGPFPEEGRVLDAGPDFIRASVLGERPFSVRGPVKERGPVLAEGDPVSRGVSFLEGELLLQEASTGETVFSAIGVDATVGLFCLDATELEPGELELGRASITVRLLSSDGFPLTSEVGLQQDFMLS